MGKVLRVLAVVGLVIGGCQSDPPARQPSGDGDGWRKDFPVEKSRLVSSGTASYFNLTPGSVSVFKEGKTTLTVTVTPEERIIDGVKTRVVEEREETGGKPTEISRNFFALDPRTGDVYYFGEEVDIYKNGQAAGHGGAWQSGAGGARFGLFVPGAPRASDRYYQEVAPKVAMDRVEVVSTSETVTTPSGEFKNCLHLRETTPLEADVGHKWFAPNVGLIKDGDAVLVSTRSPQR